MGCPAMGLKATSVSGHPNLDLRSFLLSWLGRWSFRKTSRGG